MTLEEAFTVLESWDLESTDPWTEEEREAILTIGVPYKMGTLTPEQMARFERLAGDVH